MNEAPNQFTDYMQEGAKTSLYGVYPERSRRAGARFYSAELGRFLSPDPITPRAGAPQTSNPYMYTLNNPLTYTDPTGMCIPDITCNGAWKKNGCQNMQCSSQPAAKASGCSGCGMGGGGGGSVESIDLKPPVVWLTQQQTMARQFGRGGAIVVGLEACRLLNCGGAIERGVQGLGDVIGNTLFSESDADPRFDDSEFARELREEFVEKMRDTPHDPPEGFEVVGDRGNWVNREAHESFSPDFEHPVHGPHVDWHIRGQGNYRIYPDGRIEEK